MTCTCSRSSRSWSAGWSYSRSALSEWGCGAVASLAVAFFTIGVVVFLAVAAVGFIVDA
jgi:hypothetical protein